MAISQRFARAPDGGVLLGCPTNSGQDSVQRSGEDSLHTVREESTSNLHSVSGVSGEKGARSEERQRR